MAMKTPLYDHVYDYKDVYEPAEDTFLFLDALEEDTKSIQSINPTVVLEIGSGSGLVSTFVAKIIGSDALYLCTDKNPSASDCTQETGRKNRVHLLTVTTDFVDSLRERLENSVDVLLFNPPYVVTDSREIGQGGIAYSWAGGIDGREVMDRFFPLVSKLLSSNGMFYLVVVKENKPDEVMEMLSKLGFKGEVLKTRRAGPEVLSVLKFIRRVGVKIGAVGGAMYLSVASGIWSRDTSHNAIAVKEFTESVDGKLGGGYITKVGLPSSDTFARAWNTGVNVTFDLAAGLPEMMSRQASSIKNFITGSSK